MNAKFQISKRLILARFILVWTREQVWQLAEVSRSEVYFKQTKLNLDYILMNDHSHNIYSNNKNSLVINLYCRTMLIE